jgi:hypothetical protein
MERYDDLLFNCGPSQINYDGLYCSMNDLLIQNMEVLRRLNEESMERLGMLRRLSPGGQGSNDSSRWNLPDGGWDG